MTTFKKNSCSFVRFSTQRKTTIKGSYNNAFYAETIQRSQDRYGQSVEITRAALAQRGKEGTDRYRPGNKFWQVYAFKIQQGPCRKRLRALTGFLV